MSTTPTNRPDTTAPTPPAVPGEDDPWDDFPPGGVHASPEFRAKMAPAPAATPLTDAAEKFGVTSDACDYVHVSFARSLETRLQSAVKEREELIWNLAGCDTIASGWGKPFDYDKGMARPALDTVSRMAERLAAAQAALGADWFAEIEALAIETLKHLEPSCQAHVSISNALGMVRLRQAAHHGLTAGNAATRPAGEKDNSA